MHIHTGQGSQRQQGYVAEYVISAVEEFNNNKNPPTPQLVSFNAEDVRKQAAASTQRFEEGAFISIATNLYAIPYLK
ncbi:putative fatty acid amide hydrolase [Helianthus debilis subsp. tardiflorus]